jgi:malonyl-CoA O-methyltransferase
MNGPARAPQSAPPLFDRAAIRRQFRRAAGSYDRSAVLQARVREVLIERLDWIAFTPETVVDLGCGTGHAARALAARWPQARVIGVDFASEMLAQAARLDAASRCEYLGADAFALPLPDASVDLVFSNLMLPWCEDLDAVFAEIRRVLRPRGLLTFSTLGPDTLIELRAAWRAVDDDTHVMPFTDMHDIGDGLIRAGLTEPVLDVSRYTLTYPDVRALMRDLKAIGAQNATADRARVLTGRGRLRDAEQAYERFRADGVLPATCEVVFGQAWGSLPRPRAVRDGEFSYPASSIGRRGAGES